MLRHLAPVGNPIIVQEECLDYDALARFFPGWTAHYYRSGAMALASAIKAVLTKSRSNSKEVLLPAYGCPELVSAILFAGGTPILVDLEMGKPWLSLEDLVKKISVKTAAIIAVDLLGIPERISKIRKVIGDQEITLIEDSAQNMPKVLGPSSWAGDLVILSFGRGKPVPLLGGGALLYRTDSYNSELLPPALSMHKKTCFGHFKNKLKCHSYNILINPALYWIPSTLPILKLGETRFKKLNSIEPFDSAQACMLKPNIKNYINCSNMNAYVFRDKFIEKNSNNIIDLALETGVNLANLTRYPILIKDKEKRRKFMKDANRNGLGITCLYKSYLPDVDGICNILDQDNSLNNAKIFADELITLPIHNSVLEPDIIKIMHLLD